MITYHSIYQRSSVTMNRFITITCFLGSATAVTVRTNAGVPVAVEAVASTNHPRYTFNYAVNDPVTRDNKAQWEMRDGDVVKGSYSLTEPDGTVRVVDYIADDHIGFNALVKKIGPGLHPPTAVKILTPIAPIIQPLDYGFGVAPLVSELPKAAFLGKWSQPWDPFTQSFGGWVPKTSPLLPALFSPARRYVTIFTKRYVDGKLYKWVTGPIPLHRNTLVIKKKH